MEALQEELMHFCLQDEKSAEEHTSHIHANTKVRRSKVKAAYLAACDQKNAQMSGHAQDFLIFVFGYLHEHQAEIAASDKNYTAEDFYKIYIKQKNNENQNRVF